MENEGTPCLLSVHDLSPIESHLEGIEPSCYYGIQSLREELWLVLHRYSTSSSYVFAQIVDI